MTQSADSREKGTEKPADKPAPHSAEGGAAAALHAEAYANLSQGVPDQIKPPASAHGGKHGKPSDSSPALPPAHEAFGGMAIPGESPLGGGGAPGPGSINDGMLPEEIARRDRSQQAWANLSISEGIGKDQLIPGLRNHNMETKDAREARQWLTDHFVKVGGYDKAIDSYDLLQACQNLQYKDGTAVTEKDLKMMNKILQQFYTIANADSMIFRDKEISMGDVSALYNVGR